MSSTNTVVDDGLAFNKKANELFLKHDYIEALEFYNQAVAASPRNHLFIGNRAQCHLKLENFGSAIEDATVALGIDQTYIKGYFRRATAYFALGKYEDAMKDFKKVCMRYMDLYKECDQGKWRLRNV